MDREKYCPVCGHDYVTQWNVEGQIKGECDNCEHTTELEVFVKQKKNT